MANLSFVALGTGDAFSALHYSCCLAVHSDGACLLIDCPHPIRKMIHEARAASGVAMDVAGVIGVVLTHLHADHSSGLEGLAYYDFFVLRRKTTLLAHPDVSARLWDGHLAAGMERLILHEGGEPSPRRFEDYFQLVSLAESGPVSIGPFLVECRRTRHHVPTTAVRVSAGGRSVAYSADTSFDAALVEWLARADLVVHETNYGVHTPYEKLAALPLELRRRMRLIHYPDGFEAAEVELLRQGRHYEV